MYAQWLKSTRNPLISNETPTMVEPDIEETRDLIREKVDDIVDKVDDLSDNVSESMRKISDLCDDAREDNWQDIISDIQEEVSAYI